MMHDRGRMGIDASGIHVRSLFLLLCLIAPCAAEERTLTIVSYNVENMMDVFDDPYTLDETIRVKPRAEIEQIAAVIRHLDADIVAFQELENDGILRAMVQEFLPELGYTYIVAGQTNSNRGINLGVISRLPVMSVTSYRFRELTLDGHERTWRFARDLMHVQVQVTEDRRLDLYTVHFKSRFDSDNDPMSQNWRLAEAVMARQLIAKPLQRDADAWVAIVGDFNDTPQTESVNLFTNATDGGPSLVDVHEHQPAEQRVTYLKPPYRSTIDYILVSPAMAQQVVRDKSFVVSDEAMLGGSDHAPLVAQFRLD